MPFESILNELVRRTQGAVGAMLLDWEGESVEVVAVDIHDEELRLVGAYQAVFLDRLQKICAQTAIGQPIRFEVHLEGTVFLNAILRDGYYVVLVLPPESQKGLAWQNLSQCRDKLLEEI